jgi:hypothetical protein
MLLRASSEEAGEKVDLRAAIGEGGGGVPHGELLARFAEAATRGSADLEAIRTELLLAVGPAALVEAAAIVGIFNGLVRVADSTGIPLDKRTLGTSVGFRAELGLNTYPGARSTDLDAAAAGSHARDA